MNRQLFLLLEILAILVICVTAGESILRTKRQAPSVNVHNIPKTSFSCIDRRVGDYYADPETHCQVYHVCIPGMNNKMSLISFVCPNGTIFSQATKVCTPYERVDCSLTTNFLETSERLRKPVQPQPIPENKPPQQDSRSNSFRQPAVPEGRSFRPQPTPESRTNSFRPQPQSAPESRPNSFRPQPTPESRSFRPQPASENRLNSFRPALVSSTPRPSRFSTIRSTTSTSTASYNYEYEYEYEYEEPANRRKRDTSA